MRYLRGTRVARIVETSINWVMIRHKEGAFCAVLNITEDDTVSRRGDWRAIRTHASKTKLKAAKDSGTTRTAKSNVPAEYLARWNRNRQPSGTDRLLIAYLQDTGHARARPDLNGTQTNFGLTGLSLANLVTLYFGLVAAIIEMQNLRRDDI